MEPQSWSVTGVRLGALGRPGLCALLGRCTSISATTTKPACLRSLSIWAWQTRPARHTDPETICDGQIGACAAPLGPQTGTLRATSLAAHRNWRPDFSPDRICRIRHRNLCSASPSLGLVRCERPSQISFPQGDDEILELIWLGKLLFARHKFLTFNELRLLVFNRINLPPFVDADGESCDDSIFFALRERNGCSIALEE